MMYGSCSTSRFYCLTLSTDYRRCAHQDSREEFLNRSIMEQLNRIELRGNVGNVRLSNVGESLVARFSLATNFMYKGREGDAVIETTWHNIVAWNGKGMPDLKKIEKGMPLYVCGRLRTSRFTGSDGTEKQVYEVVANKIAFDDPSPMQCGM